MDSPDFDMDDGPVVAPAPRVQVQRKPAGDAGVPAEVIGQGADIETARPKPPQREYARNGAAPDRSPPHSAEAEEHVLACCLLDDGATYARAVAQGLTPESFYLPANRLIFEVLPKAPALDLLVAELQTRRQLEAVGGMPYLMQVTGSIPTTAHAGYFIQKVREKELLRRAIYENTRAVEEAYSFTGDLDDFLLRHKARADSLASQSSTKSDRRGEILTRLRSRRVTLATKPPEPVTRLFLAKKPIATPGNLTTLISRAKTGKTAAIGGAVAAIIAAHHDRTGLDTLGFTAPHTDEAVLVLDTEQSPYDAWTCHQRLISRAGSDSMPPWLHHHALVGYSSLDLREALPIAMEEARAAHKGVFTVILDGVADFVASVNDEAECNAFVAHLHGLAVDFNCAIIAVIHSNEAKLAGDDGRGHLGKQLTRKAESNLLLKKTGEITFITSDKQRKAPITEADKVAFQWSDELGRHITCDATDLPQTAKGGRPKGCTFEMLEAIWPKTESKALTMPQLLLYARDEEGASDSTLRRIVKAAVQNGQLLKIDGPIGPKYHLP